MKKILCPTDFSETANNAIAYAAKLSQAMQADLTLLNIQSVFNVSPAEILKGRSDSLGRAAQSLEAQSLEVRQAFRISCYAEIEANSSRLSTAIKKRANDFDLIVMGSNGPDDLYKFFSGSNTYNTIVKTKTPLLLIPPDCAYSPIRSVVYAFNYLQARDLPMGGLKPFLQALKCRLTVLQILEEAFSKDVEEELHELQYIISNFYKDMNYSYDTIHSGETARSIADYVMQNEADVLALCSVHRNIMASLFHKSVIREISGHCHYPLYIFHE